MDDRNASILNMTSISGYVNFSMEFVTSSVDSLSNNSFGDLLSEVEYKQFIANDIPVIVYLTVLCILGTIGNAHAIMVYAFCYRPSNHRTFVVWLASIDLAASLFSMPFECFDIRYSLTFSNIPVCKIFKALNYFVSCCSGFLLGIIAVERYRKVCVPLGTQLSVLAAKRACFVASLIAVVISSVSGFMYGIITRPVPQYPNLVGSECTVLDEFRGTTLFKAYSVFLLFISTCVFILCIFTYSFVGKVLYKQLLFRTTSQISGDRKFSNSSSGNTKQIVHNDNGSSFQQEEESSFAREGKDRVYITKTKENDKKKRKRGLDRSKQIAFMFLVATAASYVGYLPNMILLIIKGIRSETYESIDQSLGAFNAILVRSYFFSNMANPIVYCFVDERFRRECKLLYQKLYLKCLKTIGRK